MPTSLESSPFVLRTFWSPLMGPCTVPGTQQMLVELGPLSCLISAALMRRSPTGGQGVKRRRDRWAGRQVPESPHRLVRVMGLTVLAQHHLGLVLQGLHVLRILQALCFWKGAAAVSSGPTLPCLSQSAGPSGGVHSALHLLPLREEVCTPQGLCGLLEDK